MKKLNKKGLLVAFFLALFLHQSTASASEFIEDMPQLSQDPDRPAAMIWQKPDLDRTAYTRIMIEPVTIFISPDSEYKGLNADELKILADTFRATVTKTLEPEISVVNLPGPGIMYMRAALTDVDVAKKKRGLLGYTPIGFVYGIAKDEVVGPSLTLRNATLEVEMIDSLSGERLGVLVDKVSNSSDSEDLSWDSVSKTLQYYAERFKARLQAAE
ncbi:MAG: DUF3313 domain-containing protein [Onishia taeanensis]|uniref:DUF3313 domain-containing protein n=1 Tax=Onishia taeanensis TaxID=284577 RepID=UPI003C7AF7B1